MEPSSLSFIYCLKDPDTGDVRYVGKTDHPQKRKTQHCSRQYTNCHRAKWINSLLNQGKKPSFEILEETPSAFWQDAERKWIKFHKDLGCSLVNYDDGGVGAISGGKQTRMHRNKRKIMQIYRSFDKESPHARRIATKMRFLYVMIPNMPKKWEKIGLV